jgi:hypothetical protein
LAVLLLACFPAGLSAASESDVRVFDSSADDAAPCPPVDESGPLVRGGCRSRGYEYDTSFSVRTPFGAMRFGDCTIAFELTVARDGRIWLDRITIGGASPCNDVRPCAPKADLAALKDPYDMFPPSHGFPWRGRIVAGSGDRYDGWIDACLVSCLGRFRGRMPIDLVRELGEWAIRARASGLGTDGMSLTADWQLDPGTFTVR